MTRDEAIQEIQRIMAEYGLTLNDVLDEQDTKIPEPAEIQ